MIATNIGGSLVFSFFFCLSFFSLLSLSLLGSCRLNRRGARGRRDILLSTKRTSSGGDVYTCVDRLCGRRDLVVVCPASNEADPLHITAEFEPDQDHDQEEASAQRPSSKLKRADRTAPSTRPLRGIAGQSSWAGTGKGVFATTMGSPSGAPSAVAVAAAAEGAVATARSNFSATWNGTGGGTGGEGGGGSGRSAGVKEARSRAAAVAAPAKKNNNGACPPAVVVMPLPLVNVVVATATTEARAGSGHRRRSDPPSPTLASSAAAAPSVGGGGNGVGIGDRGGGVGRPDDDETVLSAAAAGDDGGAGGVGGDADDDGEDRTGGRAAEDSTGRECWQERRRSFSDSNANLVSCNNLPPCARLWGGWRRGKGVRVACV